MSRIVTFEVDDSQYELFELALVTNSEKTETVYRRMISAYIVSAFTNAGRGDGHRSYNAAPKEVSTAATGSMSDRIWRMKMIRAEFHQPWANLRRAVNKALGLPYEFGTPNVESSSMCFLGKIVRECGLSPREIKDYLDRYGLG